MDLIHTSSSETYSWAQDRLDSETNTSSSETYLWAQDRLDSETERWLYRRKAEMRTDIGKQTFHFSPEIIARMLAPKTPKEGRVTTKVERGEDLLDLDDYDVALDPAYICHRVKVPNYECAQETTENDCHDRLRAFLDCCVDACKKELEDCTDGLWLDLGFRFWDESTNEDAPQASALVPNGPTGVEDDAQLTKHHWSLPIVTKPYEPPMHITTEVKKDWMPLVAEGATCARAMFRAWALRTFCVVIGFNPTTNLLRFLIYHRGGLTATKDIDITEHEGRRHVCLVLSAILLWKSPTDAGLPAFTDEKTLRLTEDRDLYIKRILHTSNCVRGRSTWVAEISVDTPPESEQEEVQVVASTHSDKDVVQEQSSSFGKRFTTPDRRMQVISSTCSRDRERRTHGPSTSGEDEDAGWFYTQDVLRPLLREVPPTPLEGSVVLKVSWPSHPKRTVEHDILTRVSGEFGAPEYYGGSLVRDAHGVPVSNYLFLPKDAEIEDCWWDLYTDEPPSRTDHRTQTATITHEVGMVLTECEGEEDFVVCGRHAILGWLSWYQRGVLHRDISIGNILKLQKPAKREPFAVSSMRDLFDTFGSLNGLREANPDLLEHLDPPHKHPLLRDIDEWRRKVDEQVKELGIGESCAAIVTDADCAADLWADYFEGEHEDVIYGTRQFRSTFLSAAIETGRTERDPYVRSPLDDLESFLATMHWALVNHKSRDRAREPRHWRKKLYARQALDDLRVLKGPALRRVTRHPENARANMFYCCTVMLDRAYCALQPVQTEWRHLLCAVQRMDAKLRPSLLMLLSHKYAYKGVSTVLTAWKTRPAPDLKNVFRMYTDSSGEH